MLLQLNLDLELFQLRCAIPWFKTFTTCQFVHERSLNFIQSRNCPASLIWCCQLCSTIRRGKTVPACHLVFLCRPSPFIRAAALDTKHPYSNQGRKAKSESNCLFWHWSVAWLLWEAKWSANMVVKLVHCLQRPIMCSRYRRLTFNVGPRPEIVYEANWSSLRLEDLTYERKWIELNWLALMELFILRSKHVFVGIDWRRIYDNSCVYTNIDVHILFMFPTWTDIWTGDPPQSLIHTQYPLFLKEMIL